MHPVEKPFYLAGPMTGYPQFNFPAFHSAAKVLRGLGHEIISPAEQDSPAVQAAAIKSSDGSLDANGKIAGETWGDILSKDVKIVADKVQGIIFLQGWEKSRGARLEAFVGLLHKGFRFYRYDPDAPGSITPFIRQAVLAEINRVTHGEV